MELVTKNVDIVSYEKNEVNQKNDDNLPIKKETFSIDGYKSSAKTVRGILLGLIQKFSKDVKKGKIYTAKELDIVFSEALRKFNEHYPKKMVRIEIMQGYKDYNKYSSRIWKGVDNNIMIRLWRNNTYQDFKIPKVAINKILMVLKGISIGKSINCYQMALKLGYGHTEKEAWQNLWGNRMGAYFPNYYAPLLFLEKIGVIKYGSRGIITRLK